MTTPPVFFGQYDRRRRSNGNWEAGDFPRWTPQERFDAGIIRDLLTQRLRSIATPAEVSVLRSMPDRGTRTTIDRRPLFRFLEMVYPGNVFREIEDKWIYGFQPACHRCVVEIYAESSNLWRYRLNPTPETQNNAPSPNLPAHDRLLELTTLRDDLSSYGFMLSPFRLSERGLRYVTERLAAPASDYQMRSTLVTPRWVEHGFAIAALPDPFRWVVDAHQQYYEPAREAWEHWLKDYDRQAKRTIAGVLKQWKGTNNDTFGIGDNLRRDEPEWHLGQYNNEERSQRFPMELAGLYLHRWSDQPDHRAVEISAQERRGQELSATLQMWAVVVQNLNASTTGRAIARRLVDPTNNRVPRKEIFPNTLPTSSSSSTFAAAFPNMRYAWLAGLAIFDALQSEWLNNFILRKPRNERATLSSATEAWAYLKRFFPNLSPNFPSNNLRWQAIASHARLSPQNGQNLDYTMEIIPGDITAPVDHLHQNYRNNFTRMRFSAAFLIEGFNVYFALNSMRDDLSDNRNINILGLCGTSADMSGMVFGFFQRKAEAGAMSECIAVLNSPTGLGVLSPPEAAIQASSGVATFRALGFVTGFAGGVFQALDEINQSANAQNQGQLWQEIGHTTAAVGATASAIGAAVTFFGASACGGFIAMAGAALIVGGNLFAAALSRNEYEVFASHSFLGNDYRPLIDPQITPTWAQSELNTVNLRSQLRVLQGMLLSFSVRLHNSETYNQIGSNSLQVDFGLLPPNAVLTIEMELCFGNGTRIDHRFTQTYEVKFDTDPIDRAQVPWTQSTSGNTLISPPNAMRVVRSRENQVTQLIFNVTPLTIILNGQSVFFNQFNMRTNCCNCNVKIKLRANDMSNPRDPERFLKVDLKEIGGDQISVLDSGRWDPRP